MEAEARRQWALQITSSDVNFLFVKLGNSSTGLLRGLLKQAALCENTASVSDLLMQAVSQSSQAQKASADLFDILSSLVDAGKTTDADGAGYSSTVLWIGPHVKKLLLWHRFEEAASRALHDLEAVHTILIEVN